MPKAAWLVSSPANGAWSFQCSPPLLGCASEGSLLYLPALRAEPYPEVPSLSTEGMRKPGDIFPRPFQVRPLSAPKPCCPWKTSAVTRQGQCEEAGDGGLTLPQGRATSKAAANLAFGLFLLLPTDILIPQLNLNYRKRALKSYV